MSTVDLAERLGQHVAALTRLGPRHASNPEAVTAAVQYIEETLRTLGYHVEREHYAPEPDRVNLLAEVAASHPHEPVLELGAHWDTVADSAGADDNASGVAGLLEIARQLAGVTLRRRVRLCFFGDEETANEGPGSACGSREHVARVDGSGELVEGAIVLEMIGYRDAGAGSQRLPESIPVPEAVAALADRGVFIALVGDVESAAHVTALASAAQALDPPLPALPVLVPRDHRGEVDRSDHRWYWSSGRTGVMVTDTANFRNPHYHGPADTPETLDLDFAAQVTDAVVEAVRRLAGG